MNRSIAGIMAFITVMVMLGGAGHAQNGPVATACAEDKAKFCADVPHGNGQVRACLDANEAKLSDTCKAARAARAHGEGSKTKSEQPK